MKIISIIDDFEILNKILKHMNLWDILARLVYGFRAAIVSSVVLLAVTYTAGITLGCSVGYFGGLLLQLFLPW